MGCCVSSDKSYCHSPEALSLTHEEETVKEVLSETPIPKPLSPLMIFQEKSEIETMVTTAEEVCQVPEVSEICSEGFSTRSFNEKKENDDDDDVEVTQMVGRSPPKARRRRPSRSGDISGGNDRGGWGPPKRSEPLPEGLNRVPSRTGRAPAAYRRNGVMSGVGDSGRRSRSPATVSEVGAARFGRGKNSPSITTGQYSTLPPAPTADRGFGFENSGGGDSPTANETLENPLVSLECFIFL